MKQSFVLFFLFFLVHLPSVAGTLSNGSWSPSSCGDKPEPPVVNSKSHTEFNRSIDAINEWQDRALAYNSCLVKEANSDGALISETANEVRSQLQQEIDRVVSEADRVRAELDR